MWIHHFDSEPEQQSMQWKERIGQNCHFITLRNAAFFHVVCKQLTTQKSSKYLQPKSHIVHVMF